MIPTSDPTDPGELLPAVSLSSVLIPLLVLANNHQDLDPFELASELVDQRKRIFFWIVYGKPF
jgi:hypothetical protein